MDTDVHLRIKRANAHDVPLILTFIRELAEYEKLLDGVTATEESLRATLFDSQRYAEALLAYRGSQPVAFAVYFFNYSTFAGLPGLYLEDIYVRPAYRGLGVGRQIFNLLARIAIEHDCTRIEWSVLNWNKSAIGFYQRLLAEPMQDWTVFRLPKAKLKQMALESMRDAPF